MTPSWPQQVLQRTLRSVGCPACALPPRLLRLHAAPLPGLRVLGRRPLSTVTVRAQRTGLAEGRRAAPAASFAELGLGQDLLTFLAESRLGAPTEIQSAAIPEVLAGGDVLLASHTGSGKTLAYLLPLVKLLKDGEAAGAAARPRRPRALVLGPTRELTDQLLRVAKSMSHHARFRSACVNGGGTFAQQADSLAAPLDILVGTPGKVAQHAGRGNLYYGDVQLVVLDEADTMFDRGFGPEVRAVLGPLRSKAAPARVVLVCATMTPAVRKLLAGELPGLRRVETRSLHRGVAGARHGFMEVPPGANKLDMLRQVVDGEQARGRRVMVFCNTLDSCRAAEHSLREAGAATLCYHGDIPLDGRRAAIAAFTAEAAAPGAPAPRPALVCTDLAARGLDVPGRVDHVVNFDFPLNPVDYLHRTGRTARAGAPGRITSLVAKRDAVLAQRIEAALAADRPLDELSAARGELPPHMRPKPETLQRRAEEARAERHAHRGRRGAARQEAPADASAPGTSGRKPSGKAGGSGGPEGGKRAGFGAAKPGFGKAGRRRPGVGGTSVGAGKGRVGRFGAGLGRASKGAGKAAGAGRGKAAGAGRGKAGAERGAGVAARGRRTSTQRVRFQSFK